MAMAAAEADVFAHASKRARLDVAEDPSALECRRYSTPEGCAFGDKCRFRHGPSDTRGLAATGLTPVNTPPFSTVSFPPSSARPHMTASGGSAWSSRPGAPTGFKTKLCSQINSPEGCRFGVKCHFAHGEAELRSDRGGAGYDPSPNGGLAMAGRPVPWGPPIGGRTGLDFQNGGRAVSWPVGVTVSGNRIGIPAALVGAVIGKGGANVKQVARLTGARVSVKELEGETERRMVELEGNSQQVDAALQMVQQFLQQRDGGAMLSRGPGSLGAHNFKTKICDKFVQGTCTFGERCHFAHGASDLREPGPR